MASEHTPAKKARTKSSRKNINSSRADPGEVLVDDEPPAVAVEKNVRYAEPSSLAIHSGVELGQDQTMDDIATHDVEGNLDTDLAELSLGQRLTALNGTDTTARIAHSDSEDDENGPGVSTRKSQKQDAPNIVPANSLTRTLIQALHSSDSRLLETCLAHSDPVLIRNTVRRLPSQLAVPLLSVCVERLGRGSRAANMKGGGGGASSQRGMGLVTWVKAVLIFHSGYLMTLPDLVARLSGLHATLTSRLALQESLLALNGRLDMVLSQIEMRSSTSPTIVASTKDKGPSSQNKKLPTRYVEGESEDEDEQMDAQVAVESDEEEGSIEDVELGGGSEDDDDESEGEEDENEGESDEEESDGEGPTLNGFIDDEAEEFDDEDDDGDSE